MNRIRMKYGLLWSDHNLPAPSKSDTAKAVIAALVVTLAYIFASYSDAKAAMIEASTAKARAEVNLVALMNGGVLVDRDSGMAIGANIITVEKKELLKGEYK